MYVTKQNMANAVSNLTNNLEHVSDALAVSPYFSFLVISIFMLFYLFFFFGVFCNQAAKRHLTKSIEDVDGKVDEQLEISKSIKNDVHLLIVTHKYCIFGFLFLPFTEVLNL